MKTQTENGKHCVVSQQNCARGWFSGWASLLSCVTLGLLLVATAGAQARPVNFQQNGAAQDLGGGNLRFFYEWDSSTGNLNNLGDCQVGERVDYPGNNDPYVWTSPPYQANFGTPNPTIIWLRASTGQARDTHTHAGFLQPYRADNFTATQAYRWRCTNINANAINVFGGWGNVQIVRTVTNPRANCWVYTITKSGAQAQLMPLPGSGPCGNNMRIPFAGQAQSGGSAAAFSLTSATTTLHEPVTAQFSVFNSLTESVSFDLGKNFTSNFVVSVTGPDGNTTTRQLTAGGFGLDGRSSLAPGQSFSTNLLLNQWNDFSATGDYRIQITLNGSITGASGAVLASQPTQTLYLHVGARDAQRLGAIASALADTSINAPTIDERMAAAETLSYIADAAAVPQLIRVLNQGTFVEQYAVQGLGRVGNAAAISALFGALTNPDADIRSLAVYTLNTLGMGGQAFTPVD